MSAARPGGAAPSARPATPGGRTRARLLLLGSAVSFGTMAVLARQLGRAGAGGPAGGGAAFTPGQLAVVRFVAGAAFSLVAFRLRPGLYAPANRRLLWSRGISGVGYWSYGMGGDVTCSSGSGHRRLNVAHARRSM